MRWRCCGRCPASPSASRVRSTSRSLAVVVLGEDIDIDPLLCAEGADRWGRRAKGRPRMSAAKIAPPHAAARREPSLHPSAGAVHGTALVLRGSPVPPGGGARPEPCDRAAGRVRSEPARLGGRGRRARRPAGPARAVHRLRDRLTRLAGGSDRKLLTAAPLLMLAPTQARFHNRLHATAVGWLSRLPRSNSLLAAR